jgi:peptide/nickel transport system substrate-binding protein
MRRSKFVSAMGLLATSALILSACGGGETTGGGQNTQNQKPADVGAADEVFKRPNVDPSGDFTVVREEGYGDYNNNIGVNNNFSNTVVLALQQPAPYFPELVNNEQIVLKLDGDLMESVTVTSEDPMKVEWKINKDAVWSDGTAVSCKDFYLQWLASASKVTNTGDDGSEASVWDASPTGYEDISKVECADDGKTVNTEFSKVFADYRALFGPLLPAHILEQNAGIADITKLTIEDEASNGANAAEVRKGAEFYTTGWAGFDATKALSAGPYVMESANDDEVVLIRNEKWWGGKPGPDKITVRVNRDAQSAAQQLQNKEVDIIAIQADSAVAQQLRGDSSVTTFALAGQTYEHIDFNMAVPVFKFDEFRHAVGACVNRQDIIDKLVKDVDPNAKAQGSFMFMYNEQGYEDHYSDTGNGDAAAAKKILTDAGWTEGSDGIMVAPDGTRASFKLGHKTLERRAQNVRLAASHCRPAGIEIIGDQSDNFNAEQLPASEYEAALFAWVGTSVKSSAYGNYACKPAGSANYNNYCNPEVDKKYLEANQELDFDTRIDMLNEVDKLMREDMHSLPLFVLPDFAAASSNITPISYVGGIGGVTWNAFAWERS